MWCGLSCFENPTSGVTKGLEAGPQLSLIKKEKVIFPSSSSINFFCLTNLTQSYRCTPLLLCVWRAATPVSAKTFLTHIWSSRFTYTCMTERNLSEHLTHATSEISPMISQQDMKYFSVLTTEYKRKPFHLPLYKVERETLNFLSDVQDFWQSAATHKYLALLYSVAAGFKVITTQCLAASLIGAHCETVCTNPGDKYPHAALLLVALQISFWCLSHSPALYGCSPADRAPRWKLILETLLRFKIKTQQFAVQSHWETSFDLMVICYIHFNSTGSLKWWPLFCQQKRKTSIDIWVKSYP